MYMYQYVCSNYMYFMYTCTYLLYVDFNVFLKIITIEVEDKIVDKIKPVTYYNERELIGELGFLKAKKT